MSGWLALMIIVFSTLGPSHLRPRFGHPDLERFAAFFLAGGCFAIGYNRYRLLVFAALLVAAFGLEGAQLLVPGRDARVHDAFVKAGGGIVGLMFASACDRYISRTARILRPISSS